MTTALLEKVETSKSFGGRTVAIAGGFDFIHEGHFSHIRQASRLGSYLIIITHSKETLIQKKGYYLQSYHVRSTILESLMYFWGIKGRVIMAIDTDGTVAKTLAKLKPDIFAKGGDRTVDNMPQNELEVCNEYGIEIVYGYGDLMGSSSEAVLQAARKLKELGKI